MTGGQFPQDTVFTARGLLWETGDQKLFQCRQAQCGECEDGLEVKVWAGEEARWGGKLWG